MVYCGQELYHHGIKGQRWGIRRYQNEDGSLTMSLEVPDNDNNARHIYEKYGFKDTGQRYNDWLTGMKKDLK